MAARSAAPSPMELRPAAPEDAAALAAIYAHHVLHGTATFEEVPPTPAEMATRLATVQGRGWPWLVAADADGPLGYAYATMFRDRPAYRFSCEDSIYVRADAAGRGVGRLLLDALMDAAVAAGFRRMAAVIGDGENAASIRLHAAAGFTHAGRLRQIGYKFGRRLDVVLMERALQA